MPAVFSNTAAVQEIMAFDHVFKEHYKDLSKG